MFDVAYAYKGYFIAKVANERIKRYIDMRPRTASTTHF